jgi:ABC-2 type transport system permease protein
MAESTPTGNSVPGSLAQVLVMMKYTFQDYLRSRRFAILMVIMVLIGGGLTVALAYFGIGAFTGGGAISTSSLVAQLGFYSGFWGFATDLAVIAGIFFGGDAISGEFQNKTGYFMLPNPVRRSSIYIGKWLAALTAGTIAILIYMAFCIGNGLYYGFGIPTQFVESFAFTWFYLVAALGFTFFFSSLFKSSSYSFLVTFLLFFFAFGIIDLLATDLAHIEPWFLLTYGAGIIGDVLMSPYPAHTSTSSGLFGRGGANAPTFFTYNPTIPEGLTIIAIYFIATAVLGLLLFERKEFN